MLTSNSLDHCVVSEMRGAGICKVGQQGASRESNRSRRPWRGSSKVRAKLSAVIRDDHL